MRLRCALSDTRFARALQGNDLCALLNDAYATLRDDDVRFAYDSELAQGEADAADGFDPIKTRSRWMGGETETRAVFVDENTCIGCKQVRLRQGCGRHRTPVWC